MKNIDSTFDIDLEPLIRKLSKVKVKKLIMQIPDGLRPIAQRIVKSLEISGVEVIVSIDPCYGACDIAYEELEHLKGDMIIHVGHAPFYRNMHDKVIFVEARSTLPVKDALKDALRFLKRYNRIGLATTVQHIHNLSDAATFLRKHGKTPYIGKASDRVLYDGQILGCDFRVASTIAPSVESFLVISGGVFHAVGVQLATDKPTIVSDPFTGKSRDVKDYAEKLNRLKRGAEKKFLESNIVGIIVGLKTGQMGLENAETLRRRLNRLDREAVMICAREITPENIDSFTEFDAFINTACPRIVIDGRRLFKKPILNYDEAIPILDVLEESLEEERVGDTAGKYTGPSDS